MILALGLWTAMTCLPIEGDRILARDLAGAVPAFANWPPETEIGYTPAPGVRRALHRAELGRLARHLGIEGPAPADLCVERPTAPLLPAALQAALAAALGDPGARIEMLDWNRFPAPQGTLEFARGNAVPEGAGPRAPVLWKGFVKYGERGRWSVWARARVETQTAQVTAVEDLAWGRPIQPGQLRLEMVPLSPFGPQPAHALSEVSGQVPRRSIPAGSPVFFSQLVIPPEIHSGDAITVEVRSGHVHLRVDGVAGGDGRRGDVIPVRNPATGRTFRARVEGPKRAEIVVAAAPAPSIGER